MSSPSKQRRSSATAQSVSSSNITSSHFAGTFQKSWMTQASVGAVQDPKAAAPRAPPPVSNSVPTRQKPESRPSRDQSMPICHLDASDNLSSPEPLSAHANDAQGTAKRNRIDEGNETCCITVPRASHCSKRPRLDKAGRSEKHTVDVVTATLPSPPSDRPSSEDEFRVPIKDLPSALLPIINDPVTTSALGPGSPNNPSKRKELSMVNHTDESTRSESSAHPRSPPLEGLGVTINGSDTSPKMTEVLPSSPVKDAPRQTIPIRSTNSISQPPNQGPPEQSSSRPSSTASEPFKKLDQELAMRLTWVTGQPSPNPTELARLRLLKDACMCEDEFFLVLHQMYCNPAKLTVPISLAPSIKDGIQVLEYLLAANVVMQPEAVKWFSQFAEAPITPERRLLE